MRVTNNSKALQGVNVAGGGVRFIPTGETVTVEFDEIGLKQAQRLPFLEIKGGEKATSAPAPAGSGDVVKLEAVHRGGGRYFIMDGETMVSDAMKKEDAEAFNAMSDEDKAAFVKKD